MENIVPIEKLADVVERTLLEINNGLTAARKKGVLADMPNEVQFSVTVITDFQALELQGGSVVESLEEQGGGSTETVIGEETQKSGRVQNGTTKRNSEETTAQDNAHNRESTDTYTYDD